nr:tyrosine-type recombinase/integrase [Shimia sp. R9_3]
MIPQAFQKRLGEQSLFSLHRTPHRFRHLSATLLIEEGFYIRLLQKLFGHASLEPTEIYTTVSDNSLNSAMAKADMT